MPDAAPEAVRLPSHAKLNLFLEVAGRRLDGYHDLESVFVEIGFSDGIAVEPLAGERLELECSDPSLPTDARNLALKAALRLREVVGRGRGARIRLRKTIPAGSGLGGGSSNAAAVLTAANRLWRGGLDVAALAALGEELGADVPFFLHGGVCLCEGKGERITPLPDLPRDIVFGLALPPVHCATAEAFRRLVLPSPGNARPIREFLDALETGDAETMAARAFNRFEAGAFTAYPLLGRIHRDLEGMLERPVRLSGSGSALWFFAPAGWRERPEVRDWAARHNVRLEEAPPSPPRGEGAFQ